MCNAISLILYNGYFINHLMLPRQEICINRSWTAPIYLAWRNLPLSCRTVGVKKQRETLKKAITKTCLCNVYPLEPHFYIENAGVGYAGVCRVCRSIPIFLIFAPKHRLWVLVRTASARRF